MEPLGPLPAEGTEDAWLNKLLSSLGLLPETAPTASPGAMDAGSMPTDAQGMDPNPAPAPTPDFNLPPDPMGFVGNSTPDGLGHAPVAAPVKNQSQMLEGLMNHVRKQQGAAMGQKYAPKPAPVASVNWNETEGGPAGEAGPDEEELEQLLAMQR